MAQRRPPRSIWRYDFGKYAFFLLLLIGFLIAFVVQSVRGLPSFLGPTATSIVKYSDLTSVEGDQATGGTSSDAASPTVTDTVVAEAQVPALPSSTTQGAVTETLPIPTATAGE